MAEPINLDKLDSEDVRAQRLAMYIYILPNLMTTGNLFSGFFAVIQAINGKFDWAAYAIVVAAIFDQLDGRLARLTRSTSKFGAEYDSLCDLVSFGMAPGIMLFLWALQPFGRLGWVACFLFVACGALRLARFNVQANVVEKNYFQGLPIPMAAGIVASSVLAFQDLEWDPTGNIGLLIMAILLAFVMVSNFRFRSFKDLDLKERLPFRYLILGVALLVIVALRPEVMLFVVFMSYAVLGAVFGIFRLGKNIRKIKPSVYAPAAVHESDLVLEEEEETHPNEKKT
ncbi:CDP-diacylglycerol--serine O-phosphatidyltransferase [Bdellovibrio bacteriovorus]|uniref:CDP-diacylglycerol--serine O-phosphatidyltransferase n=1 Tax=Bdellovibrio bacteriovorus TaxID=959 RepID=A0A150WS72_BDEBC|nr:CDP-diacylglycerol--serine O-phosphatidyltransferase [Bdellovibrio bacteriovorus]KYG67119.1 CDP-diacylglycerol--serine O-phosphatidyltransferase [Bdellovibrio bacteriovorus]